MNVWIYCRNTQSKLKYLLDYQENLLTQYAKKKNMKVVGITKLIYKDMIDYDNYQFGELMHNIVHKKIQAILIYDKSCITSKKEEYIEFEMLCESYNVKIIEFQKENITLKV